MLVIPSERARAKAARIVFNERHRFIRAEPLPQPVDEDERREQYEYERGEELRLMQRGE